MTNLFPEESEALEFLESLGLRVQILPPGSSKTPEFLVDGDGRGYAVEVKARHDAKEWSDALRRGDVAYQERSMGYGRWAEDVAHNALQQLGSIDPQHHRWWILWLAIRCRASCEAMLDEAIGSLFGVRQVVYYDDESHQHVMRDCLFARPGVFERHHELVASVVGTSSGFAFCVNEFATDYESFRCSALYLAFASIHTPTSASDLTRHRGFFRIADFAVDRRDDHALASYLERAYGLEKAFVIDMKVHSASMIVGRTASRGPRPTERNCPSEAGGRTAAENLPGVAER